MCPSIYLHNPQTRLFGLPERDVALLIGAQSCWDGCELSDALAKASEFQTARALRDTCGRLPSKVVASEMFLSRSRQWLVCGFRAVVGHIGGGPVAPGPGLTLRALWSRCGPLCHEGFELSDVAAEELASKQERLTRKSA